MRRYPGFHLPAELHDQHRRAIRLSWISLLFLVSLIVPLYLLSDGTQVVKAALLETVISLVPPMVVLLTYRLQDRQPSTWYPHGYLAVAGVGYVINAVALTAVGAYLVIVSPIGLLHGERPSLGTLEMMDHLVWKGWVVAAVLAYSIGPALVLARFKKQVAHALHDKQLHADAELNKADWLTAVSSIVGIVAVGLGWWWADAVAATIIGIDVFHSGVKHLRSAVTDLMGRTPRTLDGDHVEPLFDRVQQRLRAQPWIARAELLMREEGPVLAGEAWIVPRTCDADLVGRIDAMRRDIEAMSWRIVSFSIVPTIEIEAAHQAPDPPPEAYPDDDDED